MNVNTSKERSFYTQGQRFAARVLLTFWLLASSSPEGVLATPKRQPAMVSATTASSQGLSLTSASPTPPPGSILQLPPDSPGSLWGNSVAISPAIDAALQRQRPSSLFPRMIDKLTSRLWGPKPQEAPRTQAGPVAEGVVEGFSSVAVAPSPAPPSALEELISQADVLDNHTFGQALNAATLQIHHSSAGNTTQKELLTKLGAIALVSLAQGTGQISHEQVRAIEESPFSPEMLVETGLLQAAGLGQYQFPHQRIQEYFAGRSLAGKLLSKDEHERASVKRLVSEHKYAPQYGRMLSFMAGEVSSMAGFEGVEQLLTLLGEGQELVGLQHLLLQLRVMHEWLCIASD